MSAPTLFDLPTFTSHCIYCKHVERATDGTQASDAMERHYWDNHYTPDARAKLRASGQAESRMGTKL